MLGKGRQKCLKNRRRAKHSSGLDGFEGIKSITRNSSISGRMLNLVFLRLRMLRRGWMG